MFLTKLLLLAVTSLSLAATIPHHHIKRDTGSCLLQSNNLNSTTSTTHGCTEGQQRCSPKSPSLIQTCTTTKGNFCGTWIDSRPCSPGMRCSSEPDSGVATCVPSSPPSTPKDSPSPPEKSPCPSSSPSHGSGPAPPLSTPLLASPCTPGQHTCSSDYYRLLVCGEEKSWTTEMKCAAPGDCVVEGKDGEGKARCKRGGMVPP